MITGLTSKAALNDQQRSKQWREREREGLYVFFGWDQSYFELLNVHNYSDCSNCRIIIFYYFHCWMTGHNDNWHLCANQVKLGCVDTHLWFIVGMGIRLMHMYSFTMEVEHCRNPCEQGLIILRKYCVYIITI